MGKKEKRFWSKPGLEAKGISTSYASAGEGKKGVGAEGDQQLTMARRPKKQAIENVPKIQREGTRGEKTTGTVKKRTSRWGGVPETCHYE